MQIFAQIGTHSSTIYKYSNQGLQHFTTSKANRIDNMLLCEIPPGLLISHLLWSLIIIEILLSSTEDLQLVVWSPV